MEKAGILTIAPKRFDEAVWQSNTDFNQQSYNSWLQTASTSLQRIYNMLEDNDDVNTSDLYILGDVINILDNIEIKIKPI